jgi:hypothetical protein
MGRPGGFRPRRPDFGRKDKEGPARQKADSQRAAGIGSANLAGDISGSDVGIRDKLSLINQLQRESGRRVDITGAGQKNDEDLIGLLSQAGQNIKDPFFAVSAAGGEFSSVRERFRALVENIKKSKAEFGAERGIKLDTPGQSQTLLTGGTSSLLGGR